MLDTGYVWHQHQLAFEDAFKVQNVHPSRRLRHAFFLLLLYYLNYINGKKILYFVYNKLLMLLATTFAGTLGEAMSCFTFYTVTTRDTCVSQSFTVVLCISRPSNCVRKLLCNLRSFNYGRVHSTRRCRSFSISYR